MIKRIFDFMELEEILSVVDEINEKVIEIDEELQGGIGVEYHTFFCRVHIQNCTLWDSEEESREWIDDNNQEPLVECLTRRLRDYIRGVKGTVEVCNSVLKDMDRKS